MVHVYPLNDLIDHDTESTMCICGPRVDFTLAEVLVVHHSLDGRELNE